MGGVWRGGGGGLDDILLQTERPTLYQRKQRTRSPKSGGSFLCASRGLASESPKRNSCLTNACYLPFGNTHANHHQHHRHHHRHHRHHHQRTVSSFSFILRAFVLQRPIWLQQPLGSVQERSATETGHLYMALMAPGLEKCHCFIWLVGGGTK